MLYRIRFAVIPIVLLAITAAEARSVTPLVVVGQSDTMMVTNEIPLTGTVTSPRSADLSAELSGLVKAIRIEEGQRVRKGDVILKLDQELEKLSLGAAIAKSRQARLELADAKRRLADARRLARQKTISENDVQSLQAEVSIDEATLQHAQSVQRQQEAILRRHQVLAPFDGVISHKYTEAGEWLAPGDPIAELIATDNLRIDFQAPQSVFPKTTLQTPVKISIAAIPGKTFNGSIITIVPVTKAEARTFLIRAVIKTEDFHMTPGMSANGILGLDTGMEAVVVSRDAILRHPDGRTTVWIVNQDNTVSERLVKTGLSFNGYVVIDQGLEANITIVVQGNESLREGQKISIKKD
ncbi:MAG: efflux RND transporter periplasmic adaptor subunit [Gammaproteobacteria bacterium]|nr:efflux RND transporter periplasmic adaptor subunit [Gammaproteobacteria bacterium]